MIADEINNDYDILTSKKLINLISRLQSSKSEEMRHANFNLRYPKSNIIQTISNKRIACN